MQSTDEDTRASRFDDVVTLVRLLLKAPIREAVREALEEERERQTGAEDDESGTSGRRRGVGAVAFLLGLVAVAYLVRRRDRVMDELPSSIARRSESETATEGTSRDATDDTTDEAAGDDEAVDEGIDADDEDDTTGEGTDAGTVSLAE